MYYGRIKSFDISSGEGVRVSLFVSGCRNRCKGCFQPETWAFDYGAPFTEREWEEIFSSFEQYGQRGLTVMGGEPMEPENQRELLPFLKEFKRRFPDKTVWLYTGNLYEELTAGIGNHPKCTEHTAELLSLVDILVDGRYEEKLYSIGLRFRGSENQRIIDMNATRTRGEIVIWEGCREDRRFSPRKDGE
jgi:anaerobic ribonucleoside-triphosphate reductase activating protein